MIDIYVIIGISLFVVLGFRDGFSKKIFGFFGIWGGLILSIKFIEPTSDFLIQSLSLDIETAVALGLFIIFVLSILLVNLVYRWFGRSESDTLNIRNRIAGCVLGFCQGLITVSLVLIILSIFDTPDEGDKKSSLLYGKMVRVAPLVFDYSTRWMPTSQAFIDVMKSRIEKFGIPR